MTIEQRLFSALNSLVRQTSYQAESDSETNNGDNASILPTSEALEKILKS